MLKIEVAVKLLSHRLRSARMLALYGMTMEEESSIDMIILPFDVELSVFLLETCEGLEKGKVKSYNEVSKRWVK